MLNRRQTLQSLATLSMSFAQTPPSFALAPTGEAWRMPDEAQPHQRTWMAFGAQLDIWGKKLLPVVQQDLAQIAKAIAGFEPVSMLVRPGDMDRATQLLKGVASENGK